ncbi:MAG: hypothetical protein U9R69_08540 [Thermodesulfobacteriota bacterium]|nr:hypothetical protein [Thermodesulfobacteriota bacterium]
MNRTWIILLLFMTLSIAVGYAWLTTPKQRRITAGQKRHTQMNPGQHKVSPALVPVVADLVFSESGASQFQQPQKNLFGALYLPKKSVKPHILPNPVAKMTKPFVKSPKKIAVVMQPQTTDPIQPLEILGYLDKGGERTFFMSSLQGEIFLVKTGEIFADHLVVRSVNEREITIVHRQTDQQMVLQLGEASSQRLPNIKFQSGRPQFKLPPQSNPFKPKPSNPFKPKSGDASKVIKKKLVHDIFKKRSDN